MDGRSLWHTIKPFLCIKTALGFIRTVRCSKYGAPRWCKCRPTHVIHFWGALKRRQSSAGCRSPWFNATLRSVFFFRPTWSIWRRRWRRASREAWCSGEAQYSVLPLLMCPGCYFATHALLACRILTQQKGVKRFKSVLFLMCLL